MISPVVEFIVRPGVDEKVPPGVPINVTRPLNALGQNGLPA